MSLDWNGLDYCPSCSITLWALREETPQYLETTKPLREGRVKSIPLPKGLRRFRRVKNRPCPKCGQILKPIRKAAVPNIQQQTELVMKQKPWGDLNARPSA